MKKKQKTFLLFNYRAGAAERGYGEDDAAMVLAPHVLKAYLESNGGSGLDIRIMVRDRREHQEDILGEIHELAPDVAGFGCYVWNFAETLSLTRKLRLILTHTEIILGGPELSDEKYSVEIMSQHPWIDAIIRGEGEEPLEAYLDRNRARKNISGLTFRESGGITANPGTPRFPDPSAIPSFYTPEFVRGMPVVYYSTARGCVGKCRYCQEWSLKRNLPLDRIEKDLKVIFENGDMKLMGFIDSVIDDNLERLYGILDITARLNKRRVPISAYFYFRNADPKLFDALERAGFKYLRVGIESQDPETLRRVGRGEKNLSHIDNVIPYRDRFTVVPYIISHLPGETSDSFRKNIISSFRKGLLQLDFHCNRLDIFPGTYLYSHAEAEGYTFDGRPPHHVYTARNWPYEQFIEDKAFLRNVMALGKIFKPGDEETLAANGVNIFDIAATIHKILPEWKSAFKSLSSDTISDIVMSERLPFLFADYVRIAFRKANFRDAFLRLFMLRYFSFQASRIPESFISYREFTSEITLDATYFLPYFHRIKPGADVLIIETDPKAKLADLPYSGQSIFILGDFAVSGAYYLMPEDDIAVERFLQTLRNNQTARQSTGELLRAFTRDERMEFVSMIRYLKARHSLLECAPRNMALSDKET